MTSFELKNIGKKFPLLDEKNSLKSMNNKTFYGSKGLLDFWALRDIDMQVNGGEIVGLVGRNGAGKTTLLRIMAGIFPPNTGEISIKGKVSSIFTLGAGFQNELSGKENIYLNGAILGMNKKDVDGKYKSIVDFSELNDFIDAPLGTYSNGMRMRLGFSIAIHVDFDALLIDEALLVGDVSFQEKCFKALLKHKKRGKTMILASQSLSVIEELCDRVFLIEDGRIIFKGLPGETVDRYRKLLNEKEYLRRKNRDFIRRTKRWVEDMEEWGEKTPKDGAAISSVEIVDRWGIRRHRFKTKESMRVKINFEARRKLEDIHFGVAVFREDGVYCYGPNSKWDGHKIDLYPGQGHVIFEYENLFLAPGVYYLSVAIWGEGGRFAYDYHKGCYKIEICGDNPDGQLLNLPFKWRPLSWRLCMRRNNSCGVKKLQHEKKETSGSKEAKILSVEFLNRHKNLRDEFFTGQDLIMRAVLEISRDRLSRKDLRLWLGIFRSDDVYCQGMSVCMQHKEIDLIFSPLRLLPGDYSVSAGIWSAEIKDFLTYRHKTYPLRVIFTKQDHGTVYLSHNWKWKLPVNTKHEE